MLGRSRPSSERKRSAQLNGVPAVEPAARTASMPRVAQTPPGRSQAQTVVHAAPASSRTQTPARTSASAQAQTAAQEQPRSLQDIADKLSKLRFRRALWGVSEQDVWRKVRRLDEMYCGLYRDQEVRYQELLAERDALLRQLRQRRAP